MASGPITSWERDGETVEIVADFIFSGLQNHYRWYCSHEIKRRLLLGSKVMTNLDSIFKSGDITLPTKVCLVKAMVFPVVMYGCESWTAITICSDFGAQKIKSDTISNLGNFLTAHLVLAS